jgi:hypothetical protein
MITIADIVKYISLILAVVSFIYLLRAFMRDFLRRGKHEKREELNAAGKCSAKPVEILKQIIPSFLLSRLLIFVMTYFFYIASNNKKIGFLKSFKEIWYKWDSSHYMSIARHWYRAEGEERLFIVFYPLYPFLVRMTNFVIRNYFLSGIFISNICFVTALYYLYELVELEFNDSKTAVNAVYYAALFPFSFFFSIVYTESLFLMLCIMCFYFMRKKRWLLAGLFGMLASLTRNQGVLLVFPLVLELLYENQFAKYFKEKNHKKLILNSMESVLSVMLIPFGTFLYLLINRQVTGEWFRFMVYQKEHWHQRFGFFADNLRGHYLNIFSMSGKNAVGIWGPQLIMFFLCMVLLIYSTNKLRTSYILFSFAYILVSYSPTWLLSGPRYITGMFSLYLMLGILGRRVQWLNPYLHLVMAFLLCFYSIQFSMWNVL